MNDQEQAKVNGRFDTIDVRLDRLTSDLELLKEHSTDLLQSMDLLAERANQMIDSINRLSASQDRTEETTKALQASHASLLTSQARTDEVIRNFSIRQARVEDNQMVIESNQARMEELMAKLTSKQTNLDEQQTETKEIVDRIARNVDRYLNARLNGGAND